jgi:hypothetical protein
VLSLLAISFIINYVDRGNISCRRAADPERLSAPQDLCMPFVFRGKLLGYFGAWYHFEPVVRASKA